MLIFIKNDPRAYAWGSKEALPELLLKAPTGLPQAELWLGDHRGDPAELAKAAPSEGDEAALTLIDLIDRDPALYGVNGGSLPFLFKLLGIGAPLSLQVHPNLAQAAAGFQREEELGVPLDAPERSYVDSNHKPELLVALSRVRALAGWRPVQEVITDLNALSGAAGTCGAPGAQPIFAFAVQMSTKLKDGEAAAREAALDWIFSGSKSVAQAVAAFETIVKNRRAVGLSRYRVEVLEELIEHYPGDPGILLTLFTDIKTLEPGEALFVDAGQLHAYLSGVAVEVMASSDNVLRAGLTSKHVDVAGLREILELDAQPISLFKPTSERPGLTLWEPEIADFSLARIRVYPKAAPFEVDAEGGAPEVTVNAKAPLILMVISGRVRIEREADGSIEVVSARQGQSLYISAGSDIKCSGTGEVFAATVGKNFK